MFFAKRMERLKRLPPLIFKLHLLGKLLFVLGLGVLLANYFPIADYLGYDWKFWGLVLVGLGILLKIPGFLKLCCK